MRTTLALDEDVLEKAREVAGKLHVPFKTVVNEALRAGSSEVEKPAKQRPYRTIPRAMGLQKGYSLDNIGSCWPSLKGTTFVDPCRRESAALRGRQPESASRSGAAVVGAQTLRAAPVSLWSVLSAFLRISTNRRAY